MKTRGGQAYNEFTNKIDTDHDLDDLLFFANPQFCLPTSVLPCNSKGSYFIPDQIWIEYDSDTEEYNMIILEIKLSGSTNLTSGQTAAKNDVPTNLSYKPLTILKDDLTGDNLAEPLMQGDPVFTTSFYKGFKHPLSGELRIIKQ